MYYLMSGNCQASGRRYQIVAPAPLVVRDLEPEQPVESPAQLPALARPYQRLNLFRWAIPEIYTCSSALDGPPWVLLTNGPLFADGSPWPTLVQGWAGASYLQQLGWLIQVVRLWKPCLQEKVASSLLSPDNIGVLGWQIRLFYLATDSQPPSLSALGSAWLALQPLAPSLSQIARAVAAGELATADALLAALEAQAGRWQLTRPPDVYGITDPGRRDNNEDCFAYDSQGSFGIVCDGMGGHEAGEVASRMALESLKYDLAQLSTQQVPPLQLRQGLLQALHRANEQILEANRRQGRSKFRQMGTTVVAYLLSGRLLHIAHVGDSRIYLIDRHHCQQLTVDDDVANQEVSLARATSGAMLQISSSGNLTQALGVATASPLQPTVQTFVLPEECLVLLCSDGLCDGGLIERFWQSARLPLLDTDLIVGAKALVDLALEELGHDNITFILLKYAAQDERRR